MEIAAQSVIFVFKAPASCRILVNPWNKSENLRGMCLKGGIQHVIHPQAEGYQSTYRDQGQQAQPPGDPIDIQCVSPRF